MFGGFFNTFRYLMKLYTGIIHEKYVVLRWKKKAWTQRKTCSTSNIELASKLSLWIMSLLSFCAQAAWCCFWINLSQPLSISINWQDDMQYWIFRCLIWVILCLMGRAYFHLIPDFACVPIYGKSIFKKYILEYICYKIWIWS